jgi:hypothetical protein
MHGLRQGGSAKLAKEDPEILKLGQAVSPDGKTTRLIALWTDNKLTECDRSAAEEEISCREVLKVERSPRITFHVVLGYLGQQGWDIKVLYDSDVVQAKSDIGEIKPPRH